LDYFKNDSDALAKTDKIINNLSAEQFRSYMNEINSGRKDAHLDFIKGAKKSEINSTQTEPEIKQGVSELFESKSPSLISKIEEVKKAYLDFSYQTRLDRVSMLTNMFSNKVTELLEQESPEGTYTLEELQENPDLANKLKYKANPSKRKDIIALQNLDDNNVFNLVKKDLIAFINTSEEDLKVQEFGRFKNIPLYSDLTPIETDRILPHFIQAKKREYQKVLDN